ncbi:MAG: hypothetical protein ACM3UY_02305 [Methanocella sp.]
MRGREKRSTFIEHLIALGLKEYAAQNQKKAVKTTDAAAIMLPAPVAPIREEIGF